ncbi:hypothetical protein [Candidatus Magnetominusculus xianensis]|uniref:DUF1640 domain-containing protein n=1 Tax=Candidatus Magnetominusculus xianensis TaxID=1748249 RepID=A0ABR5SJV1_9BACT|nr:hypothetical protein [Candidatus Magnetominusculus xianensis]KWT85923.1 hypothetical protein ASN18_1634 [Candidatus Magnetominusculus xianensis]MBF0403596.1 DUF1640 domain-containing protein [Nitrospirota bacterium]
MATILFDTLKVVESLKSSGFSEEQAKGLSEALKVAQETSTEHLATKDDISKLELRIESVKSETLKWMFLFWAGQLLAIFAMLKAFFK